ncbi:FHA domain-containing protein [Infirmifilum lucidum]|uniref:FHA domain-containing protein n=1 Tax=Infirmifilum lucidum TaxID=2776706 RepID=A0A7L9FI07_9CREN|nr:FHA domain-containing protein [Infirmifilum lucidum]QOJ78653.1 FHA domain-containing protein [Infirmifilum lucidum]
MTTIFKASSLIIGIIVLLLGLITTVGGLIFLASGPPWSAAGVLPLVLGLILLAAGFMLAYNAMKTPTPPPPPPPTPPLPPPPPSYPTRILSPTPSPAPPTTKVVLARLEAPGGSLFVTEPTQEFRRSDFQGIAPPGLLDAISQSKPQFIIYFRGGQFFIEDSMSTNGTLLNGRQIKGTGLQPLKDGDVISPAGVINLTFRTGGA